MWRPVDGLVDMVDNIVDIVNKMMDDDMVEDRGVDWHGMCNVRALDGFIKL